MHPKPNMSARIALENLVFTLRNALNCTKPKKNCPNKYQVRPAIEQIKVALPKNPNEWDFLQLYLQNEILCLIVTVTNHYAAQYIYENDDVRNVRNWPNIYQVRGAIAVLFETLRCYIS